MLDSEAMFSNGGQGTKYDISLQEVVADGKENYEKNQ